MKRKVRTLLIGLISLALVATFQYLNDSSSPSQPAPTPVILGEQSGTGTVTKVIDGDTIEVETQNVRQKIRIIGINTPEIVDPRREVECYGKEASNRAKELLLGQTVRLESDPSQADRDRYGRLLRYVFLTVGKDVGLSLIAEGYAYEYTYDVPYKYQNEYRQAQEKAQSSKSGLWGQKECRQ